MSTATVTAATTATASSQRPAHDTRTIPATLGYVRPKFHQQAALSLADNCRYRRGLLVCVPATCKQHSQP